MEREVLIQKLKEFNGFPQYILETAFERNDYFFTDKDKLAIKIYKEKFFEISIEEIEELSEVHEVLNVISKIRKFTIKGRKEDTEFIEQLFPRDYILEILEKHIEKVYLQKEKLNTEEVNNLDRILVLLINEKMEISDVMKKSIALLERSGVDVSTTKFGEIFMQRFTEMYSMVEVDSSSEQNFEFAYKYLDLSTRKGPFNLFNNQGVSDFLQIVERLPEEKREKFFKIIKQNLGLDKIDVLEVEKRIQRFLNENFGVICNNESEFDSFLEDIQTLKLTINYKMSLQVICFILKQFFTDQSIVARNKEKYFGVLQRILEDISANDLNGVCTFFRREYSQKKSAGQTFKTGRLVILDIQAVQKLLENKDLHVIEKIYHENTHIDQFMDMGELSKVLNNSLRMLQLKEEIIKKYNPEYYVANYMLMFQEIEAREMAARKLLRLIQQVEIGGIEILKRELEEKIQKEQTNYRLGRFKKMGINSEEMVDVEEYVKQLIKAHPEILEDFPTLSQEYNKLIGEQHD